MRRIAIPLAELEPRRVCLIKPSALGDVVQTLPVLSMLRARWPAAHLTWVVNRSFAGLLRGHEDLDEVIEFDRGARGLARLRHYAQLFRRLRRERFDLTIDMQGLLRSGLMTLATAATRRVGFSNAREGAAHAYTDRVLLETRDVPALDKYCLVAEALGCQGSPPAASLPILDEHRDWAAAQLGAACGPRLVIHPGAQWETKRWPPAHFAELAERARRKFAASVVLVGGPGEGRFCRQIAESLDSRAIDLSERTSLLQLAAVCQAADVFLSGDSGPMHLAAAVGSKVLSVFTCTSPLRAGPRGNAEWVVATGVACASSYLKTCPAMICMRELTPDRVWPKLNAALGEAIDARRQRAG